MAREDVIAREARLAERKTLLDAREHDISLWEGRLEAILCVKDDDLEILMQQRTKDLGDKHKAALDAFTADSAA